MKAQLHIPATNATSRQGWFLLPLWGQIHSREKYPCIDILKHRDQLLEWAKKNPVSDISLPG